MKNTGILYFQGKGTPVDLEKSFLYFKMAADKGDVEAINLIGRMYENGKGTQVDYNKALKYYRIAIEKSDTNAMINYGKMFKDGVGVEINIHEALKSFRMAASYGNPDTTKNMHEINLVNYFKYYKAVENKESSKDIDTTTNFLKQNNETPVNQETAVEYIKKEVEKDDYVAMLFYYEALYFGIGIEENKEEAIRYLKMSADKGYSMAMYKYANILYEQNEKKKKMK